MQPQNRRFLEQSDWDGWHGRDGNGVDGEKRDVTKMLQILHSISEDRMEEYKDNQEYTSPSKQRRDARKRAEYKRNQQEGPPPVSGTH